MKRKVILLTAILAVMAVCLAMAACGSSSGSDDGNEASRSEEMQGYAGDDGASLKDVSTDNYAAVAKELFGIDLTEQEGWEIQEAVSYNGVNNLTVEYSLTEDADGNAISKEFFDQCLEITEDGIYAQDIDLDSMTVSKGASYTDFETYFTAEGTRIEGFYSSMWLYDYGGKSIQFSVSIDTGIMEVTLTLLG